MIAVNAFQIAPLERAKLSDKCPMKLLHAYLDGWRVLARVLAFSGCLLLFGLPFVLAVLVFQRVDNEIVSYVLLGAAILLCLPVATYLASWYSGEFRSKPSEEKTSEELAGIDEL